jgi:hypothetical protein
LSLPPAAAPSQPAEAGFEVARGDHSERADGCQNAALIGVDLVLAVANADGLPSGTARKIYVADRDVARVARPAIELASGLVPMAAAAQVGTSIVTVVGVEIARVEIEHGAWP